MPFTYSTWGTSWGGAWATAWGGGSPPPPPPAVETRGGYGPPTKRKQRDFDEERREREQLREQIEAAVAPLKAKKAEVVQRSARQNVAPPKEHVRTPGTPV